MASPSGSPQKSPPPTTPNKFFKPLSSLWTVPEAVLARSDNDDLDGLNGALGNLISQIASAEESVSASPTWLSRRVADWADSPAGSQALPRGSPGPTPFPNRRHVENTPPRVDLPSGDMHRNIEGVTSATNSRSPPSKKSVIASPSPVPTPSSKILKVHLPRWAASNVDTNEAEEPATDGASTLQPEASSDAPAADPADSLPVEQPDAPEGVEASLDAPTAGPTDPSPAEQPDAPQEHAETGSPPKPSENSEEKKVEHSRGIPKVNARKRPAPSEEESVVPKDAPTSLSQVLGRAAQLVDLPPLKKPTTAAWIAQLRGRAYVKVDIEAFATTMPRIPPDSEEVPRRFPKRIRMRPLEFWKNECVEYERIKGSLCPSIKSVMLNISPRAEGEPEKLIPLGAERVLGKDEQAEVVCSQCDSITSKVVVLPVWSQSKCPPTFAVPPNTTGHLFVIEGCLRYAMDGEKDIAILNAGDHLLIEPLECAQLLAVRGPRGIKRNNGAKFKLISIIGVAAEGDGKALPLEQCVP